MSEGAVALMLGTVLALGALAYVLYPIFADAPVESSRGAATGRRESAESTALLDDAALDQATGTLSAADYAELRERIATSSAARADDAQSAGDAVEAFIERYRDAGIRCPSCGATLDPGASYCWSCGRPVRSAPA